MNMPTTKSPSENNAAGYNLLMTSIALMVIGIIGVGFLQIYSLYKENNNITTNQERVTNSITVIQGYKNISGRFPCPSSINATRNTAAYGKEDCATVIPAGTCAGGICVVNGRSITGTPQPVRIGAIPFRLLQMDEKQTYDAYGNRLLYAVTQNQTNVTTYNELIGAIDVADESGQSIVEPQGSVSFAIVSQGKNKYGGFSLDGTQTNACALGVSEAANCIDLSTPPAAPYQMVSSLNYLAGAATEFDDTIEYFSSNTPTRWRRTDNNQDNIQTISNANVGIGIPAPAIALDIDQGAVIGASAGLLATNSGALRATTRIEADKICDDTGTKCFQPSDFEANPNPLMDCNSTGTKKYMTGIGGDVTGLHANALCGFVRTTCSTAGEVLIGFNADGSPKCTAVGSSCPISSVQICDSSATKVFSLKSSNEAGITNPTNTKCIGGVGCTNAGGGVNGTTYTIWDPTSYVSNYARAKFTCTNGNWIKTGTTGGSCSCTPSAPANSTCTVAPISPTCTAPAACVGSGTGSATTTFSWSAGLCSFGTGSTSYASCACPATAPATAVKPASTCTGFYTANYTWNSAPSVCAWNYTCSCTPPTTTTQTLTTAVACNLPVGNGGPGKLGFTGDAYKKQKFLSTGGLCGWADDGWDTSGCLCDTSAPPFSEVDASTCNASCENETTHAYKWYKYVDNAGTCTKTWDHNSLSVCVPKNFSWKIDASSPPTTGQTSHGTTAVGDACNLSCLTNNVVGSSSACWEAGLDGKFNIFSCTCQQN